MTYIINDLTEAQVEGASPPIFDSEAYTHFIGSLNGEAYYSGFIYSLIINFTTDSYSDQIGNCSLPGDIWCIFCPVDTCLATCNFEDRVDLENNV